MVQRVPSPLFDIVVNIDRFMLCLVRDRAFFDGIHVFGL